MSLAAVEPTLATGTVAANLKRDISEVEQEQILDQQQNEQTSTKTDEDITPTTKK